MLRAPQLQSRQSLSTWQKQHQRVRRASLRCCAAAAPEWAGRQFTLLSTGESATAHLAKLLATDLRPGDSYCLKGDQGAGKSAFCRAFIRAALNVEAGSAPAQPLQPLEYGGNGGPTIDHYDMQSMGQLSEDDKARLADAFDDTVSLIESAERLQQQGAAPEQRLALYFRKLPAGALGGGQQGSSVADANVRVVTLVPHTALWEMRVGLLHADLSRTGPPQGLVVMGDDMAVALTAGMPESLPMVKS